MALKMGATLKAEITDIRKSETQLQDKVLSLEAQVLVFPDIPQEALSIRQKLKNTTLKLRSAKVKYRWLQSGQLQISSHGKSFFVKDEDSGLKLLQALKLSDKQDPRRSQKRKHIPTSTPEKNTKLPIREEVDPEPEDIADMQAEDLIN
ncbi:UNVERIFIED_CONTAM: hypothetical protein K2H54_066608 [Gekko kuhli]